MGVRITCLGLLWLAGLGAPATSIVAAQDRMNSQDPGRLASGPPASASAEADPRRESAALPTRCFFDDFSGALLDHGNWEVALGAALTQDVDDQGQLTAAVRLGVGGQGISGGPELRSVAIALDAVSKAELFYTVQHRRVEAGERLVVEYLSKEGQWVVTERVVADGRDSVGFSRHLRRLPSDALHAAFRIRFRPNPDDEDDIWYLGEVAVRGGHPMPTLTVRLRPARSGRVELVAIGDSECLDGTTPFVRTLPGGTHVYLTAPPVVDGRVFSQWLLDGEPVADRQRVLALELEEPVEALAHYRPWVGGRSEASVAIVSVPRPGVLIAMGTDPQELYTQVVADTEHSCLTGEWLVLLAPARTERLVFTGWVVNGEALSGGQNLLEHRVAGDDVLLAEYVLLGDLNGDERLDKFDVDEFVTALIDPDGYAQRYPDLDPLQRGDINGDGVFDAIDVEGFVDLLLGD